VQYKGKPTDVHKKRSHNPQTLWFLAMLKDHQNSYILETKILCSTFPPIEAGL
jgi:hypothetical protein